MWNILTCPLTFVFWAIRIVWWRFPNWKYFYVVLVSKTFQYSFYSSSSSSLRLVIFVDVCCSSLRQHPQSRGSCTKKPVSASSFKTNIFTHIFRKMKSEKSKRCVLCTRRLLSMFVAVDVVRPLLRPSVRPSSIYPSYPLDAVAGGAVSIIAKNIWKIFVPFGHV